jgi:GxxExxY protein
VALFIKTKKAYNKGRIPNKNSKNMSNDQLKSVALKVKKLGEEIRTHLGCGFNEVIYQSALAIEFRKNKIDYLKEVNIEIFYKNESLGVDRPDFVITKMGNYTRPIILELKTADKISDGNRIQLKSYCKSFPKNSNPIFKTFSGGILMAFPSGDVEDSTKVKIFVVDQNFNVLIDEQAEEENNRPKQRKEKKTQAK